MRRFVSFIYRTTRRILVFLLVIFILPALMHLGVWAASDRPSNWRGANWSSSGILQQNPAAQDADIYVLTARTGGLKGAFATHSWLVVKKPGSTRYDRFDVVGWGTPLRKNAYDADAYWYSNRSEIDLHISGDQAVQLIPKLEQAISNYKYREYGDYVLWPGPNSNTFVASILRQVPELSRAAPSTGVGRDFPSGGRWFGRHEDGSLFASIGGYFGLSFGGNLGFEINFLGLVAGINPLQNEILVPAFGAFDYGNLLG